MSANGTLKRSSVETMVDEEIKTSTAPEPKQIKLEITSEKETNLEITVNSETVLEIEESSTVLVENIPESLTIQFSDAKFANIYKAKFITFLNTLDDIEVQTNNDECVIQALKVDSKSRKRKKNTKVKKELFVLDSTPTKDQEKNSLRFTAKFSIGIEEEKAIEGAKSVCFNCGEKHLLRDCPQPKDYAKINSARQRFKKIMPNSLRYHSESEKRANLKPGLISDDLRYALGLRANEVPAYVYLMRQLGYPPGWLEEAKIEDTELELIDIDGNTLKSFTQTKIGLDVNKVVEYPGFNIPFQKGMKDDYKTYRVPPFSSSFSKQAMIEFYKSQMIEETVNDSLKAPLKIAATLAVSNDRNSPSLVDLEQQKLQLLEELNEPKDNSKEDEEDTEKSFLAVKTTCFGTPLLKSNSPYASIPKADNFSKDVSPVINFENLPNSTGKYEQLNDVLQKVRDTLKKVQEEDTTTTV